MKERRANKDKAGAIEGCRSGDFIEVRSIDEIMATLDADASLDGLPFMPEMLAYCGRRMQVYKRADKTCDTIDGTGARRMHRTVHLTGARCSGAAHGGCQADCLMFWKEEWLRTAEEDDNASQQADIAVPEAISKAAYAKGGDKHSEDPAYKCQITELKRASEPLPWWDVRQYVRDVTSGNVSLMRLPGSILFSSFRRVVEIGVCHKLLVGAYDRISRLLGGNPYPYRSGRLEKTPIDQLDIQSGEWVRVKSYHEILKTLDRENRNRGLLFDAEMVRYCGGVFPVVGRVTQILDEKTGKMLHFKNSCIILKGAVCPGAISKERLYCPRAIHSYWREIWLERISSPE